MRIFNYEEWKWLPFDQASPGTPQKKLIQAVNGRSAKIPKNIYDSHLFYKPIFFSVLNKTIETLPEEKQKILIEFCDKAKKLKERIASVHLTEKYISPRSVAINDNLDPKVWEVFCAISQANPLLDKNGLLQIYIQLSNLISPLILPEDPENYSVLAVSPETGESLEVAPRRWSPQITQFLGYLKFITPMYPPEIQVQAISLFETIEQNKKIVSSLSTPPDYENRVNTQPLSMAFHKIFSEFAQDSLATNPLYRLESLISVDEDFISKNRDIITAELTSAPKRTLPEPGELQQQNQSTYSEILEINPTRAKIPYGEVPASEAAKPEPKNNETSTSADMPSKKSLSPLDEKANDLGDNTDKIHTSCARSRRRSKPPYLPFPVKINHLDNKTDDTTATSTKPAAQNQNEKKDLLVDENSHDLGDNTGKIHTSCARSKRRSLAPYLPFPVNFNHLGDDTVDIFAAYQKPTNAQTSNTKTSNAKTNTAKPTAPAKKQRGKRITPVCVKNDNILGKK